MINSTNPQHHRVFSEGRCGGWYRGDGLPRPLMVLRLDLAHTRREQSYATIAPLVTVDLSKDFRRGSLLTSAQTAMSGTQLSTLPPRSESIPPHAEK